MNVQIATLWRHTVSVQNINLYVFYFRCDKRKVPTVTDIEFDTLLLELPKTQLVVISVISSK